MRGFLFQITTFIELLLHRKKRRSAVSVRRGSPHSHADLPRLVSIDATGVCIATGNSEMLLAVVSESPGHDCNDTDITEFLTSDISRYSQEISMINIYFVTAYFPSLQERNY
jgi:hypothetical protein